MDFNALDYVKKEWRVALIIIIFLNIVAIISLFKFQKTEYQSEISIKLPQYIFSVPDIDTIINVGENYTASESLLNEYNVKIKGSSIQGTTIIRFSIIGSNPDKVRMFTTIVRPKLLQNINDISRERFVYEWQLRNAQSEHIIDYNSLQSKIHLTNAIDLSPGQVVVHKVNREIMKKLLTIFLGSVLLSGCISIFHYLLINKKNN